MRRLVILICGALLVVALNGVGLGQSYTVEVIEVPGSVWSGIFNLNNQG